MNKNIDIEIDQFYEIAEIDKEIASTVLDSVEMHPGFFRVKPIIYNFLFPIFKNKKIFSQFCAHKQNLKEILHAFDDTFSQKHEYVPTAKLRRFVGHVVLQGRGGPVLNIVGPSSATGDKMNRYLANTVNTIKNKLGHVKLEKYNPLSLNDIVKDSNEGVLNVSEDLASLYRKAFPTDVNDKRINIEYLEKFIIKLTSEKNHMNIISSLYGLTKLIGYIPYAEIKEFGNWDCDQVSGIHLSFWPVLTSPWFEKTPRYWPNIETMKKVKFDGCHIVPKSPKGEEHNEWRISFSAAELTLSNTFTQFQRKCYLVGKTIYYTVIKRIDPDIFASYFIKTTMFKLMEKQPPTFWENSSLNEVVRALFKDLLSSFECKKLTSFFTEDINLFHGLNDRKLEEAAIEAAAVAKYPLAFLPNDFDQKIKLIKKATCFYEKLCSCFEAIRRFSHFLNLTFSEVSMEDNI